jgi:hypothetical protein
MQDDAALSQKVSQTVLSFSLLLHILYSRPFIGLETKYKTQSFACGIAKNEHIGFVPSFLNMFFLENIFLTSQPTQFLLKKRSCSVS